MAKVIYLSATVAKKKLEKEGALAVVRYLVKTMTAAWGIKLTPKGVEEFTNWMISHSAKEAGLEGTTKEDKEAAALGLVFIAFHAPQAFADMLGQGVIEVGQNLVEKDKKAVEDGLAGLPKYN